MTYYIAEIRFNRKRKNLKRERKMRKRRLTMRLTALLFALLLVSALVMIVPLAGGSDQSKIIQPLEDLFEVVKSELPKDAFENPNSANGQRGALCNKIGALIHQVKAGAYKGALNKLRNDMKNSITNWIADEIWETDLLDMVDEIIKLIEGILLKDWEPPTIVEVLRYPETPNYDEPVTVIAHVVDERSGVKSVILNYSAEPTTWVNMTMNLADGLYVAEIPPQPYNTTVSYKIYANDWACNLATSETYSYVVIDSYPPVILYVDRIPASPNYDEDVTVFANVTEPPEASGVRNVTLYYGTDSEWQPVEMTLNQLYTGTIPAFPYGTVVQYKVRAFDYAENWAASGVYSYTVGAPPNIPPVAIFTESAETVPIGVLIHFNASESYDPDGDIVSYYWDFGDDTNATGVIADHAYASSGTYTVTLKVTDNYGAVDFASSTKTVLPNQPPVALFTESATTVFTNVIIRFNASASYDLDGTIVDYSWDFGDGNVAIGVSVEHSYADDGAYNVTLTVTDDGGATDIAISTKYVLNRPPVASFTESAEIIYTDEVVTFDATSSHDPDGVINSYLWDFGDGTNATGVTVDHAYAEEGVYIVTLTVTDDDGLTATATSTKTVLNRPPVASFTEDATTVLTGEVIRFDASGSEDLDGYIIAYQWDFGDGNTAVGVEVNHVYEDDGSYTVTLTVIDDDGATASTSAVKTVSNRPPVAYFTENATVVKKGEVIHFDASGSSDPDGYIVSYFWEFGDGTNATDMIVDHAYAEEGTYIVTLTVTDDDGAAHTSAEMKTVEALVTGGWPLALLAAMGLGIAALTATLLYALYRRRKKKRGTASGMEASPSLRFVPQRSS